MADFKNKGSKFTLNIILILIVIALAIIPLFTAKDAEFAGADGKAEEAIGEIAPGYTPWFTPFWEPPSGEIESLLFALQAAMGAGVIGYGLGYIKGKNKENENLQCKD